MLKMSCRLNVKYEKRKKKAKTYRKKERFITVNIVYLFSVILI